MADQEEDFSLLPLPDRVTHKASLYGRYYKKGLLKVRRIGKYERRVGKMLRKLSLLHRPNQILSSGHLY